MSEIRAGNARDLPFTRGEGSSPAEKRENFYEHRAA
jgi:hypothetical protein